MALSRYRNLNTLEDKKFIETSNFPTKDDLAQIPTIQIVVTQFDRLDNLAHVHLGDGEYWWIIALFNDIDWAYKFEENQVLQIPIDISAVLKLF